MISIVIPNYNGLEHLETCYDSLNRQTFKDFHLIIVDNGSVDESVNYTLSVFPDAKIIKLGYNSGFARAVNEGIKYSLSATNDKFVLLLNNDIELEPDFLEKAVSAFENHKDASILAVKMLNYYNRDIIDDCGDLIKGTGGSPIARGHDQKDIGQFDKTEYIFGACAGAAFYREEIFKDVGFFDETFFAYYEDIDFSFRAQLYGLKCLYEPSIKCYHKRGGTSSIATHGFQTEMCERNLVLMRFKNYPLSIYVLYQPFFLIARLRRYWSFWKIVSFSLLFRGFRGYIRGQFLLLTKIGERFRIQSSKKVTAEYIRNLFVK